MEWRVAFLVLAVAMGGCRHAARNLAEAAASGTSAQVAEFLERDPASLEALDVNGQTPLRIAAAHENAAAVNALLERGASVDARDAAGETALHLAAAASSEVTVNFLLEHGADWSIEDAQGRTPLQIAIRAKRHANEYALRDAIARGIRAIRIQRVVDRGPAAVIAAAEIPWRRDGDAEIWEIWGVRDREEHEALRRLPTGFHREAHAHSTELREIVVTGRLVETSGDGSEHVLGPGSSFVLAPGEPHAIRCEQECIVVEHQLGAADELAAKIPGGSGVAPAIHVGPSLPLPLTLAVKSDGVDYQAAWHDKQSNEEGGFSAFPPSFDHRAHFHRAGHELFWISGRGRWEIAGIGSREVGPGDFVRVPAKTVHHTRCISATPCFTYDAYYGWMDTTYVDAPAAEK